MQRVMHLPYATSYAHSFRERGWILQCDNCGWVLDVSLWPSVEATEFIMENCNVTRPKKAKVVCKAGKVTMIIFFWWIKFSVSLSYISKPHLYSSVLPRSLAKIDRPFWKKTPSQKGWKSSFASRQCSPSVAHIITKFLEKQRIRTGPCPMRLLANEKRPFVGWCLSRINVWLKLWRHDVKSWVTTNHHLSSKSGRNVGLSALHWWGVI